MLFYDEKNIEDCAVYLIYLDLFDEEDYELLKKDIESAMVLLYSEAIETQLQESNHAYFLEYKFSTIFYFRAEEDGTIQCLLFPCASHPDDIRFNFHEKSSNPEFFNFYRSFN